MRESCDTHNERSPASEPAHQPEPGPLTAAGRAWLCEPQSGRRFFLQAPLTILGRSAPGAVALGADPYLSRRHAAIQCHEADYWFVDLQSANGSFINQRPVSGPQRLSAGDTIQVGMTALRFELATGDWAPAEETHG